jgi:Tol biopolymer transport system component
MINAGSNKINLTIGATSIGGGYLWSPDSKKLLFIDTPPSPFPVAAEIYVIHADGSHLTRLSYTPSITQGLSVWDAVWSPDSSKIVFVRGDVWPYSPPDNYLLGFGIGDIYVAGVEE